MTTLHRTVSRSLVAAAVAAVAIGSVAQAGTTTTLKDPTREVGGTFGSLSMAVDEGKRVHIAAERPNGNLVYITNRSGDYTTVVVATGDTQGETGYTWDEPSIALDENGRVTIAAVRSDWGGTGCDCTDGIFIFSDKGRARGTFPTTGAKRAPAGSHAPSVATQDGHFYLAYRLGASIPEEPASIRFRTNASGSWTDQVVEIFGFRYVEPDLEVRSNGKVRIAYTANGVFVASSATVWGDFSIAKVTNTNGKDHSVDLELNADGSSVVAFVRSGSASDGLKVASGGGGSWSSLPVSGREGTPALAVDADGYLFIALAVSSGPDAGLYTYGGSSLTSDELYDPRATSPAVSISETGLVSLAFISDVSPKGIYVTQD